MDFLITVLAWAYVYGDLIQKVLLTFMWIYIIKRLIGDIRRLRDPGEPDDLTIDKLPFRTCSPGYWTLFLFPVSLYFVNRGGYDDPQSAVVVGIILFNCVLLSILHWFEIRVKKFVTIWDLLHHYGSFPLAMDFSMHYEDTVSFYTKFCFLMLNMYFPTVFIQVIESAPKSFSFGEGIVTTSAFMYGFWRMAQTFPFPPEKLSMLNEMEMASLFLQGVFVATILIAGILRWKSRENVTFPFSFNSCNSFSVLCAFMFSKGLLFHSMGNISYLVHWPYQFLTATPERIFLIRCWLSCCIGAFAILFLKNRVGGMTPNTVDRKSFHLLLTVVLFSGVLTDFNFTYVCTAVLFFIFVLLEAIRITKLSLLGLPIGTGLDSAVAIFRDNQDEGQLLLTPIYLLTGCALPLWLIGWTQLENRHFPIIAAAFAGVFSVGIGDTFASVGGTMYGKTKWIGSNKTLEGTATSVIAQILAMFCLLFAVFWELEFDLCSITSLQVSFFVNAIVEAKVQQIDNLIIPLVSFNTFYAVKTVCDLF